jgi:hypothetical protein
MEQSLAQARCRASPSRMSIRRRRSGSLARRTAAIRRAPTGKAVSPVSFATAATQLSWIAGCWTLKRGDVVEEHWMKPAGGTLRGIGRTEGITARIEGTRNDQTRGVDYVYKRCSQ